MNAPDFNKLASVVAERHADRWDEDGDGNIVDLPADGETLKADIVTLLEQVWNARGAADAAAFSGEQDHRDILERIKALDR